MFHRTSTSADDNKCNNCHAGYQGAKNVNQCNATQQRTEQWFSVIMTSVPLQCVDGTQGEIKHIVSLCICHMFCGNHDKSIHKCDINTRV